jgi:predicted GNAT superfamily acetyltransferase
MSEARATREVEIRHCSTLAEYEECVRIERLIWGEDMSAPSARLFVVARHTGGQTLGAFDRASNGVGGGTKMIGFTLAFAGMHNLRPFLHSHLTAVLPEFRDRGVGRRLKLFQRQDALNRGIDLVEWTFDPLDLKNAHFNLARLGAIARRYIPNCYGVTESPLHAGLPTDRLVAEWWIGSDRMNSILADKAMPISSSAECISLPANLLEVRNADRAGAARIQGEARDQFLRWFAKGYAVTSFKIRGQMADYVLEPAAAIAGLRLPDSEKN